MVCVSPFYTVLTTISEEEITSAISLNLISNSLPSSVEPQKKDSSPWISSTQTQTVGVKVGRTKSPILIFVMMIFFLLQEKFWVPLNYVTSLPHSVRGASR